jgi:hypothetical protein
MKVKLATATLSAALILAGAPGLASAANIQSGPIHINRVMVSGGTFSDADGSDTTILPGMVAISFTNRNAATANDVVFAVEDNGYVAKRFNDVGMSTPKFRIRCSLNQRRTTTWASWPCAIEYLKRRWPSVGRSAALHRAAGRDPCPK